MDNLEFAVPPTYEKPVEKEIAFQDKFLGKIGEEMSDLLKSDVVPGPAQGSMKEAVDYGSTKLSEMAADPLGTTKEVLETGLEFLGPGADMRDYQEFGTSAIKNISEGNLAQGAVDAGYAGVAGAAAFIPGFGGITGDVRRAVDDASLFRQNPDKGATNFTVGQDVKITTFDDFKNTLAPAFDSFDFEDVRPEFINFVEKRALPLNQENLSQLVDKLGNFSERIFNVKWHYEEDLDSIANINNIQEKYNLEEFFKQTSDEELQDIFTIGMSGSRPPYKIREVLYNLPPSVSKTMIKNRGKEISVLNAYKKNLEQEALEKEKKLNEVREEIALELGERFLDEEINLLKDTLWAYNSSLTNLNLKHKIYDAQSFYNPVETAIQHMPFSKKGTITGHEAANFLTKKSPHVKKSVLDFTGLMFDPKKVYTKDEIQKMYDERAFDIVGYHTLKPVYESYQRQSANLYGPEEKILTRKRGIFEQIPYGEDELTDPKTGYVELFIDVVPRGEQANELDTYSHFSKRNLAHLRGSVRKNPETNEDYFLVEELQSDSTSRRDVTSSDSQPESPFYPEVQSANFAPTEEEFTTSNNLTPITPKTPKPFLAKETDETVRASLLQSIVFAKNHGLNKVVIPTVEQIAEKRGIEVGDIPPSFNKNYNKFVKKALEEISKESGGKVSFKNTPEVFSPKSFSLFSPTEQYENLFNPAVDALADQRQKAFRILKQEFGTVTSGKVAEKAFSEVEQFLNNPSFKEFENLTDQRGVIITDNSPFSDKVLAEKRWIFNSFLDILYKDTEAADFLPRVPNAGGFEIDISNLDIDPERTELRYNKGGLVPEMDQTEEAFQIKRDPISGNEVPPGARPEEVRDDVDAKLSVGEYVVPANVVRFIGVEKLEKMVENAKIQLAEMEKTGRTGKAPEMPEFSTGGLVMGSDRVGHVQTQPNTPAPPGVRIYRDRTGFIRVFPVLNGQVIGTPPPDSQDITPNAPTQPRPNTDRTDSRDSSADGARQTDRGGPDISNMSGDEAEKNWRQQKEITDFLDSPSGTALGAAARAAIPGAGFALGVQDEVRDAYADRALNQKYGLESEGILGALFGGTMVGDAIGVRDANLMMDRLTRPTDDPTRHVARQPGDYNNLAPETSPRPTARPNRPTAPTTSVGSGPQFGDGGNAQAPQTSQRPTERPSRPQREGNSGNSGNFSDDKDINRDNVGPGDMY